MITLLKQDSFSKALMLVGLETDTKPTEYFTFKGAVLPIRNGSTFYEADTATFYVYDGDSDTWIKQSGGGYPEPTGTVQITQNGVGIDVKDYAEADVAVPNTYVAADEGKVVSNGSLTPQSQRSITSNGTVDTTLNNECVVAVPNTYAAGDEGKVVENGSLVAQSSQSISANGTYDTTKKNEVVVNVSDSSAGLIERSLTAISNAQVTEVGDRAFTSYGTLASVNLPSATKIGLYAFDNCSGLSSLILPLVTTIGGYAIEYCTQLVSLDLPSLISVGDYVFYSCGKLENITAPLLSTMGINAFQSCSKLKNIKFDALTYASFNGFYGCTSLESADLAVCSEIRKKAFYNCSSLSELILRRTIDICVLNNADALQGTPIASGTGYIYVPQALKSTYEAATNWVTYASQFRALEDYTVDGTTTGALDPSKI